MNIQTLKNLMAAPVSLRTLTLVQGGAFISVSFIIVVLFRDAANLSMFYFLKQDYWLFLMSIVLLLMCSACAKTPGRPFLGTWQVALFLGAVMATMALVGHFWLLFAYDISRDEQMATFDSLVFARGHLVEPLPRLWRDHAEALNTTFMYPAVQRGAWISSYLPFNALLRTVVGLIVSPAFTGPLLTALGALAMFGCARKIWPDDREAVGVALLLYLGSGQILYNGMTAYAMPAHLTANLCWLWLFMQRTRWADSLALVLSFVAVGLHQPTVHILSVGPLLLMMLLERDWRRAAFFALGFAVILGFWFWWPNWIWTLVQSDPTAIKPPAVDYITRLKLVLAKDKNDSFQLILCNIIRFFSWQHIMLFPLLLLSVKASCINRLAGMFALSGIVTLIVMYVILPYQGHGFGYRYLHGSLGYIILLAVFGWKSLSLESREWRSLLRYTTVAGLIIILPMQAWMAHAFYAPFAQLSARINQTQADYMIVGQNDAYFSIDLVINPPQLDRRPIRLIREYVDWDLSHKICAQHASVVLLSDKSLNPIVRYFGAASPAKADNANRKLAPRLAALGCQVSILD